MRESDVLVSQRSLGINWWDYAGSVLADLPNNDFKKATKLVKFCQLTARGTLQRLPHLALQIEVGWLAGQTRAYEDIFACQC